MLGHLLLMLSALSFLLNTVVREPRIALVAEGMILGNSSHLEPLSFESFPLT